LVKTTQPKLRTATYVSSILHEFIVSIYHTVSISTVTAAVLTVSH